ncbi:MAG: glycosyltransferase, partial [Pseudomonadota bacterium]
PRYEPYGMTPLEGMATGVPLVGTGAGNFRTISGCGEAGIVVEGDAVQEAVAALDRLLGDPARLGAMGRAARARAVAHHSVEIEAAGIAAVYEALWTEGSARARSAS